MMNRTSAKHFKYFIYLLTAILTALVYFCVGRYFYLSFASDMVSKNNLASIERMKNVSNDMVRDYDIIFKNTNKLAKFIQNNPNAETKKIESFIGKVLMPRDLALFFNRKNTDFVHSYVIAKDDIISLVYSNQKVDANDISIFTNEEGEYYKRLARTNSDEVIVQGPVLSPNSHEVLVYNRQAVYVNGQYWGYVALCADFYKYLECIRLNVSDDYYEYAIRSSIYKGTSDYIWGDASLFRKKNKLSRQKSLFFGKQRWDLALKAKTDEIKSLRLNCILLCSGSALVTYLFVFLFIGRMFMYRASESIDSLTNTLHHRPFLSLLSKVLKDKHEHGLLIIEILNFKQVNSIYGYETGDSVLKEISSRLKATVAYNDRLSRVGGEFMVLKRNIRTTIDMERTVSETREALSKIIYVNSFAINLKVLVGSSNTIETGKDLKTLFQVANMRLDEDKINLLSEKDKTDPVKQEAKAML